MPDTDAYLQRLEARIAALEGAGDKNPEDERLDNLLRKFARSIEMTAWLGGLCLKVAPIVAALWFFGEQGVAWLKSAVQGALQ